MLTSRLTRRIVFRPVTYVLPDSGRECDWSWKLTVSQINYRMRVTLNDGRQMTGQVRSPSLCFRRG
jgi:hypothetical protein